MIDREIKEALAMDPSPEFLARVRMRIANEPAPAQRRVAWWLAAAATVAAAIVFAIVLRPAGSIVRLKPDTTADGRQPDTRSVDVQLNPDAPSGNVRLPAPRESAVRANAANAPSYARSGSLSEPETLLDPAETRALRALIAGVREGRIDLTPSTQATAPSVLDLEPIQELAIAPLVIAPVEGVRQ